MAKNIRPYLEHHPQVDKTCYIDEMAVVVGDVSLAENVSVWPFAVIRGDVNSIQIGKNSNVRVWSARSDMLGVPKITEIKRIGPRLLEVVKQ